ncbi:MAG: hypothetical protein ABEI52_06405, partial [Halobacteriaceae archaeon]
MDPTVPILIGYLLILLIGAWYVSREEELRGYFLTDRQSSILLLTFSNFSSIIGAGATVAIVAEVYRTGISFGLAMPVSFMVGAFVLGTLAKRINEVGREYGASNLADFFGIRFDAKNELLVGLVQVVLAMVWIAIQAIAFSSLVTAVTNVRFLTGVAVASIITIMYTAMGGLKIDLVSDAFQFWIICGVFTTLTGLARSNHGWTGVVTKLPPGHLDP